MLSLRASPLWRGLTTQLPVAFVMASLATAAIVPLVIHRRISDLLDTVTQVIEPARHAVGQIQLALAQEIAGTRGFLLTGDSQYAASRQEAQAARGSAFGTLEALQSQLEPEVRAAVSRLAEELAPADILLDALFSGRVSRDDYMASLPAQQNRFQIVLARIRDLDLALSREAGHRGANVHETQLLGTVASVLILVLALAATILVARLGARQRWLTEREHLARQAAEAAQAEGDLRRLEIERMSAGRDRLIRGFSHDVRNPIGAAQGHLWMLREGVMDPLMPKQRDAVEKSLRSLTAALTIIEDLLDIARKSWGTVEIHRTPIDLREVVTRTIDDYRGQAANKSLSVEVKLPAEVPAVQSDSTRVSEILGNIISNAIKYTPAGRIVVAVGDRCDASGRRHAVVEVTDTGPGIPRGQHELIFTEFYRLSGAPGTSGAGIGLAISQQLALALGGRITVDSELGRGSTFTLWLPLGPVGAVEPGSGVAVEASHDGDTVPC